MLENSELYRLETRHLQELFETDIYFANFGGRLIEEEFSKTKERLIAMQLKIALERYEELVMKIR